MTEPRASRPHMPGYGTQPADEGTGLLPWSWVETRLGRARNYWINTVTASGRPYSRPVWAVWLGRAIERGPAASA